MINWPTNFVITIIMIVLNVILYWVYKYKLFLYFQKDSEELKDEKFFQYMFGEKGRKHRGVM